MARTPIGGCVQWPIPSDDSCEMPLRSSPPRRYSLRPRAHVDINAFSSPTMRTSRDGPQWLTRMKEPSPLRQISRVTGLLLPIALIFVISQGVSGEHHPSSTRGALAALARVSSPEAVVTSSMAAAVGGQSLVEAWPVGPHTLWAYTDGQTTATAGEQGLQLTTDGGGTWSDVEPSDCLINAVFALSSTHAWVTCGNTARQTIESTSNAGRTWSHLGPLPSPQCQLQFASSEVGWCTDTWGAAGSAPVVIYRSTDGGTSWKKVFSNFAQFAASDSKTPAGSLPFGCDKDIEFASVTRGWALFACNAGLASLYETFDGGKKWVSRHVTAPTGTGGEAGSSFLPTVQQFGRVAVVGLDDGTRTDLFVSTDGAASFHSMALPGPPRMWTVDAVSATTWRLLAGDHILATDNAGRTWLNETSSVTFDLTWGYGSPSSPVVYFTSRHIGWIIEGALWRTIDGGRHWARTAIPGTNAA